MRGMGIWDIQRVSEPLESSDDYSWVKQDGIMKVNVVEKLSDTELKVHKKMQRIWVDL